MREPPKMTRPHADETMTAVVNRFIREMNEIVAWTAEAVAEVQKNANSGNQDAGPGLQERECSVQPGWSKDGKYKAYTTMCSDCGPDGPCERAREVLG